MAKGKLTPVAHDITKFTDEELLEELHSRGWDGILTPPKPVQVSLSEMFKKK